MEEAIKNPVQHFWLLPIATSCGIKVHLRIKNVLFQDGPKVVLGSYHIGEKLEVCVIISSIAGQRGKGKGDICYSLIVPKVVSKIMSGDYLRRFECRTLIRAVQFVCRLDNVTVST